METKALVCELCGSNDLVKDGGYFVCQHCGTKYTVEEARKMMIEGTVDVSGSTIKVDNSSFVEKYLANARRAKQKEDWEEVEKYYNLVEQNDPTNVEAIFYSSYGKTKQSLVDSDIYKRQATFKVFQNSISVVDDNFDVSKETEQKKAICQMASDIIALYGSNFVFNTKTQNGSVVWSDKNETLTLFNNVGLEFSTSMENIAVKFTGNQASKGIEYYKIAIEVLTAVLNYGSLINPTQVIERIMKYHNAIKKLDSSYVVPEPPTPPAKKSGCYVATCVYGSYDCPQVWTLRRYRDDALAKTWLGRAFIHTYYAISPTIVKWFGKTEWFKKMWRGKLDKMVQNLNAKGYQNSPYDDKNW